MLFLPWQGRSCLGTVMDELFGMENNKLPVVSLQVKKKEKKILIEFMFKERKNF